MARVPPIKEQPQFGVGTFEALSTFEGLKALRFAFGTAIAPALPDLDEALANLSGGGLFPIMPFTSAPSNLFGATGQNVLVHIGKGLTATQAAAAEHYVTRAWALDGIGAHIEQVAEDVLATKKYAQRKTLPARIVKLVRPNIRAQLRPYAKRTAEAEARARKAERHADALAQRVANLERKTLHHGEGIVVGLPPRVGIGEREIERIKAGLRAVWGRRNLAAFIALLLAALSKIGASWIRCSNVRRFGRRLCGMDTSALDALLAGTVLIVGSIGLVEFARGMQGVMDEIEPPVRKFWRVTT